MKKPSDNTTLRVTMGDVARRSGVHASTVSAVLAGKAKERRISSDIAARVRRAAAELDFTPNLVSRSLRAGATQTLSFFNGYRWRDRGDLYMDALTTAIERAAGAHEYDIYLYCNFQRTTEETYSYLNGGRSDGLIFFAPQDGDPLLPYLRKSRLPVVLLGSIEEGETLCSVQSDQTNGMRQVAQKLLELGHRNIAAIMRPEENRNRSDSRLRLNALRHCLQGHAVTVTEYVVTPTASSTATDYEALLRLLLAQPDPPTALFCWHDHVGYRVLEACANLHITVPQQLSVIGFDGLHWPSTSSHLLASVHVPLEAMAQSAVSLLHKIITGDTPTSQVFPVSFHEGTTLAPPPRGSGV